MNALSFTIAAQLDAAGFTDAARHVREVGNAGQEAAGKLGKVQEQAQGFLDTLKEGALGGFSAGLGIGAAEKTIELIEAGFERFKELASEGVKLNAELETQTLGLAATLRSVEPEKYLSFEAAKNGATEAIAAIRQQSAALGQDSRSVIEAYGANLSALSEAGVVGVGQQVQLVTALISAAASKGISGVQALRDVIDILNGRAGNIVLAKELGLENIALKEAAANGTIYSLIMGKLVGYNEGLTAQADSFRGLSTSIAETGKQLLQVASEDAFKGIEEGLSDFKAVLADPSLKTDAAAVGKGAGELAANIIRLGASAVANREQLAEFFNVIYAATAPLIAAAGAVAALNGAINKPGDEAVQIGRERIETNRKLIDQAETEVGRAVLRNSLARQLADLEGQIAASRITAEGGLGQEDTALTATLQKQSFILQDQLNYLDAQAGKHVVIAAKIEEQRRLSDAERASLTEANAALDQQAQSRATLAQQAENLREATAEQVRKTAEALGLDPAIVAGLRTREQIEAANLGLTERQVIQLKESVVLINQAADAEQKARDARAKGDAESLKRTQANLSEDQKRLAALEAIISAADRSTPKAEADYLGALQGVNQARQNVKNSQRDVDTSGADVMRDAFGNLPGVGDIFRSRQAAPDAPASTSGYGDTFSRTASPAPSPADSGADAAKVAGEAVKAGGDAVKAALDDGLTPAGKSLTAAAGALPGQLAGITGPLGTLLATQDAHFVSLTGLIETQADVSKIQQGFIDGLARDYATLSQRLNNYIASHG